MQGAAAAKRYQEAAQYKQLISALEARLAHQDFAPREQLSAASGAGARAREPGAECWGGGFSSRASTGVLAASPQRQRSSLSSSSMGRAGAGDQAGGAEGGDSLDALARELEV